MLTRFGIAFTALVCLGAFTAAAPAPKYRPSKAPAELLKKMQGVWEYTLNNRTQRIPLAGQGAAAAQLRLIDVRSTTRIRIEGDQWSYVRDLNGEQRVTTRYTIKLDPSKKPTWLDLVRDNTNTPYLQGVVAVDGDTMVFSYVTAASLLRAKGGDRAGRPAKLRPAGFDADGDLPQITMTLRRVARP